MQTPDWEAIKLAIRTSFHLEQSRIIQMDKKRAFSGVFTALVTPMKDGRIDFEALESLVEEQISAGVAGLVPVGTTGESPTVSFKEHIEVVRATIQAVAGRVPVIAGSGANSTAEAIHLTQEADAAGADGFLQVCPEALRCIPYVNHRFHS